MNRRLPSPPRHPVGAFPKAPNNVLGHESEALFEKIKVLFSQDVRRINEEFNAKRKKYIELINDKGLNDTNKQKALKYVNGSVTLRLNGPTISGFGRKRRKRSRL